MRDSKKYNINLDRLPEILFIVSLCALMFCYGFISNKYKLFPYRILSQGVDQYKTLFSIPHQLLPIRYNRSGARIHNRDKIMPGVTLITSYWPETGWTPGIRLIDLEGKILHHWEVKAKEIWPESPHRDHVKNVKNSNENYVQGTYLFPNGDIIFNVSAMGLVRMNSRGDVLWKLPSYRTHHSVFRDEDGNFWVSGLKWVEPGDDRIKLFPGLQAPYVEETAVKVSPEGELLKEISVLEALYKGNYQHFIRRTKGDLLHLNDVEVISSELAEQSPFFEIGDIVVSMRYVNAIAMLDQSGTIKWLGADIFVEQHDPDFEQDGWITVLNNRTGLGRSTITKINPASGDIKIIYPSTTYDQPFYTAGGGKHQKLNNGNRLITEAHAGRIFEISPEGETVWEWIQQPYKENYVPEVLEGTRYSIGEKEIAEWEKAPSNQGRL